MMSVSSSPGFDARPPHIVPAAVQTLVTSSPPGQSELRTSLICPVPAACNRIATFPLREVFAVRVGGPRLGPGQHGRHNRDLDSLARRFHGRQFISEDDGEARRA